LLMLEYHDNKPSISLMGVVPDAFGDVSSPPRGRAVAESDLRNLEARRRFGQFGSTFVASERLRQSRRVEMSRETTKDERMDGLSGRCCVTRQFAKMYPVSSY
jgi:hypothetical protein